MIMKIKREREGEKAPTHDRRRRVFTVTVWQKTRYLQKDKEKRVGSPLPKSRRKKGWEKKRRGKILNKIWDCNKFYKFVWNDRKNICLLGKYNSWTFVCEYKMFIFRDACKPNPPIITRLHVIRKFTFDLLW